MDSVSESAAGPIGSLWRLRPYLLPYRRQLVTMLAAALLGVGASIVVPLVTRSVVDGPVARGDRSGLVPLALLAVGLGIAEAGLIFTRRWIQNTATLGIEKAIRRDVYEHLQKLPPSFHDRWQTGQLLSRATTDLSQIRRFIGFGLVFLIVNIATFATIISILVVLDPLLGGLVGLCLLPLTLTCWQFERRFRVVSRRSQDQQGDLATAAEEAATGIRVIHAFGRRHLVTEHYVNGARDVHATQMQKVRLRASFVAVLDVIPNLTLVVVLLIGAAAVAQDRLSLGSLVAFITLVLQLVWPVEALGFILAAGQEAGTAAQRVYELLDSPVDITDLPAAREISVSHGHLRFENVGFSYPDADSPVLSGVDLDIRPGETLALVGLTGSGKSTLTALVPRLADVSSGRITLDGIDIRDFTLKSLRALVATAFEEPTLFSASVRENVTLGSPDASDAEVRAALELAQAGFVDDLPWGLATRVGEQGMSLSGGQRQRLALARAVVGRPRVLVLDDPLSALDVETEALVEAALRRVLASTTALLVVHRPSTVALADRVALLSGGTVRAVGTHSELMATVPEYADILGSQEPAAAGGSIASTDTAPQPLTGGTDDLGEWRGVAADRGDELPERIGILLRQRSRRLLGELLRPHRRSLYLLLALIVTENLAMIAGPYLVGAGIDVGIPAIQHHHGSDRLWVFVALLAIAAVLQAVTQRAFMLLSGRIGQDVVLDLRTRLFTRFQLLSQAFHEDYTSGRVIARQTSDIEAINEFLEDGVDSVVTAILSTLLVGVTMLVLDWPLALVGLGSFIPLAILTRWFRRESAKAYRKTREAVALVVVQFVETLGGIRAVQAFRREPRNAELFEDLNEKYRKANKRSFGLIAIFAPSIKLVGNITVGIVLLYGGYRVIGGQLEIGVLTSFLLYLRGFFDPLQDLSQTFNSFQSAGAALEKIAGVLDEPLSVPPARHPVALGHVSGELRFQAVRFGYRESTVIPDLDLSIAAAQTVALVGQTGAGKTTIARLLGRFYDPTHGRITLDGVDLRDIGEADLHRAVVTVTQESFLFSGTVADNIAFGRPDASRSDIVSAAREIGAHDFITRLPEGYDTDVRKRGGRLSAGQRQLVSFARAFLADPAVLILDEATSSLDIPSERLVQQALRTILADRTAVIIAHRLSTVAIADRVLVLSAGRVVEDGAPRELVAAGGRYAELHRQWQQSLT